MTPRVWLCRLEGIGGPRFVRVNAPEIPPAILFLGRRFTLTPARTAEGWAVYIEASA